MATVFGKGFSIMADNALFDTNVLLDCAIQGRPGHDDAVALLDEIIAGRLVPYACATSLKDVYYVLTKHMGERDARRYVAALLDAYRICPVDRQICQSAIQSDEPDFEDGVIRSCAENVPVDVILTRDASAFASSPVRAMSPRAYRASVN